jgi:hypothetical protein
MSTKVCYNCFGEKGFWIDRKDPRNPDYAFDMCEDYFEECSACKGTGVILYRENDENTM